MKLLKQKIKVTKNLIFISGLILGLVNCVAVLAVVPAITNIAIVPDLDISLFNSYNINADITENPTSVELEISGINQDGGDIWNYYVDGRSYSETITKTMTDANDDGNWVSANIYPDSIYPEIFFAPSSITWYNTPSNIDIRRANYHLLHFNNPFVMEGSSTFFIEFNAWPRSANSANLDVYLVKKDTSLASLNSDWRNSASVELVGTINRNDSYHHTHILGKSSHHLIALSADDDGKFGSKNLDINGDFWLILYTNSPNTNRGWDLKYHSSNVCDNITSWYVGNQSSWSTTAQSGCPDVHIHLARRGTPSDGVSAIITATYTGLDPVVETQEFYFEPLPNLAPNPTSFLTPVAGAVYDSNEITISWNPGTDPNNDSLNYNIYYYDDSSTTTIESATTTVSFVWDVSAVPDGSYGLMGEVCDNAETPLCTEFYLSADFTLDRVEDIYSVSEVSISSSNITTNLAKAGDIITLSFTASGDISPTLAVDFYSGGASINNSITSSTLANVWTVYYIVSASDTEGTIDYVITANNLDYEYSVSTPILVDLTAPTLVSASPTAGNYVTTQSISLSSSGSSQIRYTLDGTIPSCSSGLVYSSAISLSTFTTLNAIGCDEAGNSSALAFLQYEFSAVASAPIILPSGVGEGVNDQTIPMDTVRDIGYIPDGGVNVLAYINSQADFTTPPQFS